MHLVFATSLVPDGAPKSGYDIANAAILGALARAGCRVTVMGFAWPGKTEAAPEGAVVLGEVDPRTETAGTGQKLGWLATALPRGLTFSSAKMRVVTPNRVRDALAALEPVDGVILNSVQFAGAFEAAVFSNKPTLYVAHNVEHHSALESAVAARGSISRFLFRREARLLMRLEERLCARARFIYTLSEDDRRMLGVDTDERSVVLPLVTRETIPAPKKGPRKTTYDATLIGTWTWAPNRIGLDWFLEKVVPLLPTSFKVAIAGYAPDDLREAHKQVDFVGRVDDAAQFVRSGKVVPLVSRAGTGVQLKTIETFEQGLPSVATQSALRGISHIPENCIIADEPQAFAEALARAAKGALNDLDGREFHQTQKHALDAAIVSGLERAGLLVNEDMA